MSIKVALTQEGFVVRRIEPHGEDAWRKSNEGGWSHRTSHEGPWISTNDSDVPKEVLAALEEEHDRIAHEIQMQLDSDECGNCGGNGWVESCFEDCCVCTNPPCHWLRCDHCNHRGQVSKNPPPIHGGVE